MRTLSLTNLLRNSRATGAALFVALLLLTHAPLLRAAAPVSFAFEPAAADGNPYARELWADVTEPSGKTLRLPAFFAGDGRFEVRARAEQGGEYRLGAVLEGERAAEAKPIEARLLTPATQEATVRQPMLQVGIDAKDPRRFALADGAPFCPLGANLAWAPDASVEFYRRAFGSFAAQGLNWARVWMAYWSGMNLEWIAARRGRSPALGTYDQGVAARWDEVVSLAEDDGVRLQLVLQHHGPYSSTVNSNWADNPFNAANPGGFLESPADFFTDARARSLTRQKYRYIVARWGWSPAIMAWELFNEVHWTDAYKDPAKRPTVAAWHAEMAAYIRSVDAYHHLVTTSTEDLSSAIYDRMDYYQPHAYPLNILLSLRCLPAHPPRGVKPVFYGEMGDDHIPVDEATKESGVLVVPPVWASLMGEMRYPAQLWRGEQLLRTGRVGELGAVARFLRATRLTERDGLVPETETVECAARMPLVITGSHFWQERPEAVIDLPLDGREPEALSVIPCIFADHGHAAATGFPGKLGLRVDYPAAATFTVRVDGSGAKGSALRLAVDGRTVATRVFPASRQGEKPAAVSASVGARIEPGRHLVEVENNGGEDWFSISGLDTGLDQPVLASVGKRGDGFIACWLWNRKGVFSMAEVTPVSGTLDLADVPAGTWRVVWWDTLKGEPAAAELLRHPGGLLRVPTPPISRHAAVVLTRER